MSIPERYSYKISRPLGRLTEEIDADGWAITGTVLTPDGIVEVYADTYNRNGWTLLSIARGGYVHEKRIYKYFKMRHLVTLAARFAAEVCK